MNDASLLKLIGLKKFGQPIFKKANLSLMGDAEDTRIHQSLNSVGSVIPGPEYSLENTPGA
jgi:hypothetical protein